MWDMSGYLLQPSCHMPFIYPPTQYCAVCSPIDSILGTMCLRLCVCVVCLRLCVCVCVCVFVCVCCELYWNLPSLHNLCAYVYLCDTFCCHFSASPQDLENAN